MLKKTIKFENHSASGLSFIGYGVDFEVPGRATGDAGVSVTVDADKATALAAAVLAKRPAMEITVGDTFDDGVAAAYAPYVMNNLAGDGAPAVTNDDTEGYSEGSIWIDAAADPKEVYRCVDPTEGAAVWLNTSLEANEVLALLADYVLIASPTVCKEKTPVNAVASGGTLTSDGTTPVGITAATGVLTASGAPNDGETVTIGETVYTFKTALTTDPATVPNEVLIGETPLPNLVLAINGGEGVGTIYSTGTVAHPDVTAAEVSENATTITAKVAGAAGNEIDKATTVGNFDWDGTGAYFTGGRDAQTITIDEKTYTLVAALTPLEGEVLIGASAEATLLNLKNAINHAGTPDTDYKCAAVHPTVTAVSSNATTLVVAAKTKGVAGDEIATTETETGVEAHVAWGAEHLAGGVDGTVGLTNEFCQDGSYLYVCGTAGNTITGTNWRKVDLGSAY